MSGTSKSTFNDTSKTHNKCQSTSSVNTSRPSIEHSRTHRIWDRRSQQSACWRRQRSHSPLCRGRSGRLFRQQIRSRTWEHEDGAHSRRRGRWLKTPKAMRNFWSRRLQFWQSLLFVSGTSIKQWGECPFSTARCAADGLHI